MTVATTLAMALTACGGGGGGDPTSPRVGSLELTITTTGESLDPDGYMLAFADGRRQAVGTNVTVTFPGLEAGEQTLELTGVAENCAVRSANPLRVSVPAGGTAQASIEVTCTRTLGTVRVVVSTIGSRLDPDGYTIVLGDRPNEAVGVSGTVVFSDVPSGVRTVRLVGLAANCDGHATPLEQNVTVPSGSTVEVTFAVICGPLVLVDEAHFNFHTIADRYRSFAEFLRSNGYVVKPSRSRFQRDSLEVTDVLVIANALAAENVDRWVLPTPSAFSPDEIAAVRGWVDDGGSLFLIADHMPFPGAAEDLAAAFGVRFRNGFALDTLRQALPADCLALAEIQIFRRSDGSLADHPITSGIDSVGSFTGQAFEPDAVTDPLLVFGPTAVQLLPNEAWVFPPGTPQVSIQGWRQGAVGGFGRGRAAFFGDATMFFDKVCGPDNRPNGMNSPAASQNRRLLLNVLRWLLGELDGG